MEFNFWIILLITLLVFTSCYCVKKELFENGDIPAVYQETGSENTVNYTVIDVSVAIRAILKYFKHEMRIIRVLSIKKRPKSMEIRLLLYNMNKNIIQGYTCIVNTPMSGKKEYNVDRAIRFSSSSNETNTVSSIPYIDNFSEIDLKNGQFN